MVRVYSPDRWVIVKLDHKENSTYKVLGGWSGGYLDGDSWRLNSGIESYEQQGKKIVFKGYSGSEYHCGVDSEQMSMAVHQGLAYIKGLIGSKGTVEVVDFEQYKQDSGRAKTVSNEPVGK